MDKRPVSVTVTYWIGSGTTDEPTKQETFSSQDDNVDSAARIGLPIGNEPSKPDAGSFEYSGMHDHGPLVPPREGGDVAQLIGCVQAAQRFNNDFMTHIIQVEKESANIKNATKKNDMSDTVATNN